MSRFAERADRLEWLVAEAQLDLLLTSDMVNVRYLTGFGGTNGICLTGTGKRVFVTDFRYAERARSEVGDWDLREGKRDLVESIFEVVAEVDGEGVRLGFDDAHVTVRQHERLSQLAPDGVELVPAAGLVERLRQVKDAAELEAIRAASAVADELYRWLIDEHGLTGHSERAVALALQRRGLELGAQMSFPPIVASGVNGAQPHAEPGDMPIARDTLVVVDMGCKLDDYCSDCTRTFATDELPEEAAEIYEIVRAAQLAALSRTVAGVSGRDADAAARDVIEAAGHGERFGHGTGHGVGLEVHEGPTLSPRAEAALECDNVVTVEPGIYLPGRFGVRIEDLVVVGDGDCEILTGIPKDLTVV